MFVRAYLGVGKLLDPGRSTCGDGASTCDGPPRYIPYFGLATGVAF